MPEQQYDPTKIEPKWQDFWERKNLNRAEDFSKKPKIFLLVEFPYPSGAGLHVGHCRSYTAMDIIARKKRMQGYNVLFPMGWDAFGLPSENYAIKTGIHPSITTKQSIETFKKQEKSLGLSFDWQREVNTTDPAYYKWTQWLFLKLFERGLAYKAKIPINWCLSCKIGLANEEVVDGRCERCGGEVEKREKEQWLIKITDYAQRLIDDLALVDFPERVKALQKDWIGKSKGYEITFTLNLKSQISNLKPTSKNLNLKVFTTRVDTIFGCTYLVVAPEHEIIKNQELGIKNYEEVDAYVEKAKKKSDRDRQADVKDKTGVKLEGVTAINPANNKEIPIFVADYVLAGYGTGAIMAVPAHDQRDWDFAKRHNLEFTEKDVVITSGFGEVGVEPTEVESRESQRVIKQGAFEGVGHLINSAQFNGKGSLRVGGEIGQWLCERGLAEKKINYKLRDWVFSRQRYWGEPIPLIFCSNCCKKLKESLKLKVKSLKLNKGEILNPGWVAIPEKNLPVQLPEVEKYQPTETGESPLAGIKDWLNTKCPKCGGPDKRETDVMPNWAGSNWYFMRYCDPYNDKQFASPELLRYWMPVDWYNGGMEHTTLHLLYSRFIYKFLWDIGEAPKELGPEPYKKRTSHGMILAEGGEKMSKSKGNVLNPDDIIKQYGADTLRLYEMFMGPFEQAIAWDTKGVKGVHRFLKKIYKLQFKVQSSKFKVAVQNPKLEKLLHKTIKKVSEDIEVMKFNTAVSSLMILVNEMEREKETLAEIFEKFLLILSPFAPHIAEQLFSELKIKNEKLKTKIKNLKLEGSIFEERWPGYDENLIKDEKINLIVQINGKVRAALEVERDKEQDEVLELIKKDQKISKWLENKEIKRVIFVKNKLINLVL